MHITRQNSLILFVASAFIVSVLLYSLSLRNGFVWDAEVIFTQDNSLHDLSNVGRAFGESVFNNTSFEGENVGKLDYYRPVIKVLHILEYQFFAEQALGYKVVNVVLNGFVVGLFFAFVHFATRNTLASIVATMIYMVSPVRAEAVYWTYADGYIVAALFVMLSLISYQSGRNVLAFIACLLALFSHESAVMLPVVVLLYAWLIEKRKKIYEYKTPVAIYFGAAIIYLVVRTIVIGAVPLTQQGLLTYLNTVVVMLQRFVKIFFIPDGMITLYPKQFFTDITLEVLISYGVIIGLIGLSVYFYTRRRDYLFWYLWFFVWVSISFNLGEFGTFLMSDKLLYLSVGGFSVVIGLLASDLTQHFMNARKYAYSLIGMAVFLHAGVVYAKAKYWHDTRTYLEKASEFSPDFFLAHYALGHEYIKVKEYDKALEQYSAAVRLYPKLSLAHNNMGNIYFMRQNYDRALSAWHKAIEADPKNPMPYYNIGLVLMRKGDQGGALRYFDQYLQKDPEPDPGVIRQVEQIRKQQAVSY